jgi:NitT/TauT family transport system permease protein
MGGMSEELVLPAPDAVRTRRRAPVLPWRRWSATLLALVVVAVVWETAKLLFAIPDYKLPHLSTIFGEFFVRTRGGSGPIWAVLMLRNAAVTLGEAFTGFVMGSLLGCALAVAFASSPLLERALLPYVVGSQLVPILAIAPMVVIGAGQLGAPDWLSKALIAAYLTFFPVTIGMLRGLRSVSPDARALMHSYAASSRQTFWKLRLPASLPYLFTALKVSATASVIGAIVGELPVGSAQGIGVVLVNAAQYYNSRPQNLWATVIVASLIGLVFYGAVVLAERLVIRQPVLNDE